MGGWVIVFNPGLIQRVEKLTPEDVKSSDFVFDLPKITRTAAMPAQFKHDTDTSLEGLAGRVASRYLTANFLHVQPNQLPVHEAAKADEALGTAYRSLVSLKLGFDAMQEIPQQSIPLYGEIGKAIDAVAGARQYTTQVREMVKRKRY